MPHALAWNIGTITSTRSCSPAPTQLVDHPGEGVQPGGAVAVDHALGVAGRAARVAHRRRLALIELGPLVARLLGTDELVVGQRVAQARGVALSDDDDVLDGLALVADPGEQGRDGAVDDHHLVLPVVDHVGQLLGEQADVEGVEHRPHRGHGQVRLEVLLVVPGEGPDPVIRAHTEPAQGLGQLLGSRRDLREGRLPVTVGLDGDHTAVAVDRLATTEDAAHQERPVLHRAQHSRSLSVSPAAGRGPVQ